LGAEAGEPVELLTGTAGCYLMIFPVWGRLLADPVFGVTVDGLPINWPAGTTGVRLADGGVELRIPHAGEGEFVATTGKDYWLANGMGSTIDGAFPACSIADADPELLKGHDTTMAAQRASVLFQRRKEGLVLRNIGSVWCETAPRPNWCEWVRRDETRQVVAKIEEDTLKVGVREGTPVEVAEKLCRDVAADDNVLPDEWVGSRNKTEHVYSLVDVEAVGEEIGYGPIGMDWFADGIEHDGSPGFRVHRLAKCSVPWDASPSP
jgi:hypothetical protein